MVKGCRDFLPSQKHSFWGVWSHSRSLPILFTLEFLLLLYSCVTRRSVWIYEEWLMC